MRTDTNNLYKEGTIISARVDPTLKLIIHRYYQRIYYCGVVNDASRKDLAYFERELLPPIATDQVK